MHLNHMIRWRRRSIILPILVCCSIMILFVLRRRRRRVTIVRGWRLAAALLPEAAEAHEGSEQQQHEATHGYADDHRRGHPGATATATATGGMRRRFGRRVVVAWRGRRSSPASGRGRGPPFWRGRREHVRGRGRGGRGARG